VQFARALDDHAAVVIIAGDLVALGRARHHVGAGSGGGVQEFEPLFLLVEMRPGPGADKAARLFPVAIDFILGDQPVDEGERVGGVGQEPGRPLRRDLGAAAGKALADIDPAADRAAVPGAGAKAQFLGFEHDRLDPVLRKFERADSPP
jgi:hypothetical protein